MKEDQEHKCHFCRFCKQSFSNGKKLGGHMRGHLALISASRIKSRQENAQNSINGENGLRLNDDDEQIMMGIEEHDEDAINGEKGLDLFDDDDDQRMMGIEEHDEETINGEKGVDFDDEMIKKSQQEMDVDQDYGYVLRENPKKSWRVSNSIDDDDDDDDVCKKCGKGFHSSRSLANHMRCHSRKESTKKTNVCEKCGKGFDSVKALYGHMRCHSMIKRSRPSNHRSSSSSSEEEEEEDNGVQPNPVRKKRSCTRYKSAKHNHHLPSSAGLSSCDDETEGGAICLMMLSRGVRNLDGGKLVISHQAEFAFSDSGSTGSGQMNPGRVGSNVVGHKSSKEPRPYDQDFGNGEASEIDLGGGIDNGDREIELKWVHSDTEWDPLSIGKCISRT